LDKEAEQSLSNLISCQFITPLNEFIEWLKGIRNTIKMSYSAKNGNDKNEIKAILI